MESLACFLLEPNGRRTFGLILAWANLISRSLEVWFLTQANDVDELLIFLVLLPLDLGLSETFTKKLARHQLKGELAIFKKPYFSESHYTWNSRYPLSTLRCCLVTLRRPNWTFYEPPLRKKNTFEIPNLNWLDFLLFNHHWIQPFVVKPTHCWKSFATKVLVLKNEFVRKESIRRTSGV